MCTHSSGVCEEVKDGRAYVAVVVLPSLIIMYNNCLRHIYTKTCHVCGIFALRLFATCDVVHSLICLMNHTQHFSVTEGKL
jgi:hypothetical protein